MRRPAAKIMTRDELLRRYAPPRSERLVFTNGCFDLLHRGHVEYLARARELGDVLVVGLNADASVRRLKGAGRPVMAEVDRAFVLAALEAVDAVTLFDEDTPLELVAGLLPDVLVKGGDYTAATVVGREDVESAGGRVVILPLTAGRSTSALIESIRRGDG
jgi:rfaE bifunctional protein nucleotidyltransferase chain/domain